jgi:ATP-dependent DNA ligase
VKEVYWTDVLVAKTKAGLKKYWQGYVLTDGEHFYTQTRYWQELQGGESSLVQESEPVLITPKNVGKKNETHPKDQAISEIDAAAKRQRDKKGYDVPGVERSHTIVLPMLAEKYLESSDKLVWPVYVQPKLDGHRALHDGRSFTTRGGQEHKNHVWKALRFNTYGLVYDGELMLAPDAPCCKGLSKVERFQLSASVVKNEDSELVRWLRYYVYDCYDAGEPGAPFSVRLHKLTTTLGLGYDGIVIVPTLRAYDDAQVQELYQRLLRGGYEGAMIRSGLDEGYTPGHRSDQLQKLKEFQDAEFVIVGVKEGKGKFRGTAIFEVEMPNGSTCDVTPTGSLNFRQTLWVNRHQLVGAPLTVRFEGYTKDGKLRFPRGLGIRDVWDR